MRLKKPYKFIITLVLTIVFGIQTFYGAFIIAGYYVDTPAYAAKCVNKNKPQLHCNGKCMLQKKLNEADNKEKQNTEHKTEINFSVLSSKSFFASVFFLNSVTIKKQYPCFNSSLVVDVAFDFFQPPRSVLI
jgi:hypothetical protein